MRRPAGWARTAGAGWIALAMAGCATHEVEFHRWPNETPAANNAADITRTQGLGAAAAAASKAIPADHAAQSTKTVEPPPPVTPADAPPLTTYDPLARLNRFTYRFNARFDEAIFLPVANGYRRLLPAPVRSGVHQLLRQPRGSR